MIARLSRREHFSALTSFKNPIMKITVSHHRFSCSAESAAPVRRDIFWWNSAITRCFRNGEVENACKLFDDMPHRNLVTWNCMITGYVQNFRLADAQHIFDLMPHRNVVSWTALMTGYLQDRQVKEARKLFDKIPQRNVVCWNSMISGCIRNGMIGEARELFDGMPTKNSASWSTIISGYIRLKSFDEALNLFKQSPYHSASPCNAILSGFIELGCINEAEDLFASMESRDAISWNLMITCYLRGGKLEQAQQLFDEMPVKDVISWTTIIRGYLQCGNVERASALFQEMPDRDVMAWNTMMGGFIQNGMFNEALNLFNTMPGWDIVSWNTILQGFVQESDMLNARRWFENMPQRSETSWNTLIYGYQNEEALALFCEMVKEGFKPDRATLVVVLPICAFLVALGWGRMLHLYVVKSGYEFDTLVASSLISMYSKCGSIGDSIEIFYYMSKRDTIAWNAMMSTYAYYGFAKEALQLYKMMIQSNFFPDHATFLNLLLACSHKGLIDEGCKCFKDMQEEWNLVPRAEHYSCLVDLLGRSGFVLQAYKVLEKVPEDLQTNAWETLLSACQVHGCLEVGELSAKRVFDGRNPDGGMHVLLSNIYASKGRWSEASQIRALMKEHGLKKETGCSWIEVKGKYFTFLSNDKSNPQAEEICRELDTIFLMLEGTY